MAHGNFRQRLLLAPARWLPKGRNPEVECSVLGSEACEECFARSAEPHRTRKARMARRHYLGVRYQAVGSRRHCAEPVPAGGRSWIRDGVCGPEKTFVNESHVENPEMGLQAPGWPLAGAPPCLRLRRKQFRDGYFQRHGKTLDRHDRRIGAPIFDQTDGVLIDPCFARQGVLTPAAQLAQMPKIGSERAYGHRFPRRESLFERLLLFLLCHARESFGR